MTLRAAEQGVDWMLWTLATDPRIKDPMVTIRDQWTVGEIALAHIALDARDDCKAIAERAGR